MFCPEYAFIGKRKCENENMPRAIRHSFTLMEVMIAATILALAVVSTMGVVAGARSTLYRAEQRWARQHLLAQAVEFYLLAGQHGDFPSGLLPDGFSASCELYEVEDIHEDALDPINGWQLCEYYIFITDEAGVRIAETTVRKVLKEEDLD